MSDNAGETIAETEDELPQELTITLRKPVEFGGEVYSVLPLREPTGLEWLQFEKVVGVEGSMLAISLVSGVPLPAVKKIGTSDIVKATAFINRFF